MLFYVSGLSDEELEEERLHELEKVMQSETEKREEKERVAAEEALLKAKRQEEWVCPAVHILIRNWGVLHRLILNCR